MLIELTIRNFAIIDDLKVQFSAGLTVLSGETGAGKSIIINAVNLLLGSRATSRLIRTGADHAELEAGFDITPHGTIANLMKQQGFDPSEGLIVRRIISRNDRHKVYINGRLATMHQLGQITENLASISGQHAHQGLLKEDQHLIILDQFGGLMKTRETIFQKYHKILPLIKKLDRLKAKKSRQQEHLDLLEFQKKEIQEAGLSEGEDEQLEKEKKKLKNSDVLLKTLHQVIEILYDGQGSVNECLVEAGKQLGQVSEIDSALNRETEKISEAVYGLEDITEDLRQYSQTIQTDTSRLVDIEDRLDFITKLKRKYGGSISAIEAHFELVEKELQEVGDLSGQICETENELARLHQSTVDLARQLTKKRKQIAQKLAGKVEKELSALKMPQTEFNISLESLAPNDETPEYLSDNGSLLFETGFDKARFLISPNVGEAMKPLADIASGGELSRVVLALKAILAKTDAVETIVFDEVDAGIGGGVAEVVGEKLVSLAKTHQVICITHLAQIAKFGDQHFKILKTTRKQRTQTNIALLNTQDRIQEIARMLGGIRITQTTLDHAEEMLQDRE